MARGTSLGIFVACAGLFASCCFNTTETSSGGVGRSSGGNGSGGNTSGGSGGSNGGNRTGGGPRMACFGDGGACTRSSQPCGCDADCCSGECKLGECVQAVGESCLSYKDCGSAICMDGSCECNSLVLSSEATNTCIVDGDCCNGIGCHVYPVRDAGFSGECCNGGGASCESYWDCCSNSCVDGGCVCITPDGSCSSDTDCCNGRCLDNRYGYTCLSPPGAACQYDPECLTQSCDGGSCLSCSGGLGPCASQTDCCAGLLCAPGFEGGVNVPDSGNCCVPGGAACGELTACCSGVCTDAGICGCVDTGAVCVNDQSCCYGGTCVFDGGRGTCCQSAGATCFFSSECCDDRACSDAGVCQ